MIGGVEAWQQGIADEGALCRCRLAIRLPPTTYLLCTPGCCCPDAKVEEEAGRKQQPEDIQGGYLGSKSPVVINYYNAAPSQSSVDLDLTLVLEKS